MDIDCYAQRSRRAPQKMFVNNRHFAEITRLLKQAHPKLSAENRLEFKNVFGAIGGYVNGRIFISCGKFGVALRLPPEILDALFQEKDVKRLKYFPKGHIKKEYAVLPERITKNNNRFRKLVANSVKYVLQS